jgi:hypothetical protein
MSHNLQCTHYGHILLTHTHSCTKCPTANIQQSKCHTIYSVYSTVTSCWPTHTPAQSVQQITYNKQNITKFTVYTVRSLPADPLTLLHKVSNCQHTTIIMSHNWQWTQYGHFLLLRSDSAQSVQLSTYNNHNVTQFTVYTVRSLPADPLTHLHKMSNCQHTTIIMSHNLQCTQYCYFLLTHSHSCTNCPTANTQQS